MARAPSRQSELYRFLQNGKPRALGAFFSSQPEAAQKFLGLTPDQFDRYIDILTGLNGDKAMDACARVYECLAHREKYLSGFRTKRKPNDLLLSVYSIGRMLSSPFRGDIYGVYSNLSKASAELYAGTLKALGIGDRTREVILAGLTLPASFHLATGTATAWSSLVVGAVMGFNAATNDAEAALPPPPAPEPVQQTLEINVTRFGPTEITVRPAAPFNAIMVQSAFKLMPALEKRMMRDPQAVQYVGWLREAAAQYKIDPNLFANQIFKESAWFDKDVISGEDKSNKLAGGIAQWTPKTAAAYGLSENDIFDPRKAIFAAAHYMSDLTKQYGDQQLAMIAYNGGPGAINFVRKELAAESITITQWMDFMRQRRTELGTKDNTLWHNQSFRYIRETSSQFWHTPLLIQTRVELPATAPLPYRPA